MSKRIPVTILTGFLGSGKTTLLNQILDENKNEKKLAVIENEFAAAFGIENEIIHQDKIEDIQNLYEFGMGCVCCSTSGELINALEEISMRNHYEAKENQIEHVILETTGLADPTPISELIRLGANKKGTDNIVKNYYIQRIVTLIDSKHIYQTLNTIDSDYKNEVLAQILTTDVIVLNKIDLLSPEEISKLEELKQFISQHNPTASIITTSFSNIPIRSLILDPEPDSKTPYLSSKAKEEALKQHDPAVEQTMVLASGLVNLDKVKSFIKTITEKYIIYRIKGILALPSNPDIKYVIQGVQNDQLSITEHGTWLPEETKESRLTFIGRNIMQSCHSIENGFKQCSI